MNGPRWNLKHLIIAIAALAVSFAAFGVAGTVIVAALGLPAALARPGRRLAALYWVAACYPWFALLLLYLTWLAAWAALGHPPRPSLDDPKDIGPIEIPHDLTALALLWGTPIALLAALGLTIGRVVRRTLAKDGYAYPAALLAIVPASWLAGYFLLRWDPMGVLFWYMD